jgi:RNA polymerase sigma-70 factor (ECF subfamily)
MNAWLRTLSKENRAIFLRRYWFGDSIKDIAAATGLRENAVSVRLNRLRDKLKDYLYMEGYYE